jgi:translation initiation factor 2 beta subunit (eIF-2beta)/eIF-5
MKTFTNISDAIDTYNSLFTKCKEINDIDKTKCDDVNICETDTNIFDVISFLKV